MILGAIVVAVAGWAFTFGWTGGNFWLKIGISVVAVCSYSLLWRRPSIPVPGRSFLLGLVSAAVLYGIFYVGDALAPYFIRQAPDQVSGIYGLGEGTSRRLIFFLLLLVTGPGEEIFWRGFLQSELMKRWGRAWGYLAATALYAGVHLFSGNAVLVLAALVAGAFWGMLYLWRQDLFLLIVSHSVWSAVIFAVAPVH